MLPLNFKKEHQMMDEVLGDLATLLQKEDVEWSFELLDLFWRQLTVHIRAENVCLFPTILNAPREIFGKNGLPDFEEVKVAIDQLRADHNFLVDQLSQALRLLRELLNSTDAPPADVVTNSIGEIRARIMAVSERLRSHAELEEEQVYKWPELILSPEQLETLQEAFLREGDTIPRNVARPG